MGQLDRNQNSEELWVFQYEQDSTGRQRRSMSQRLRGRQDYGVVTDEPLFTLVEDD